ncbi:MAG: DUF1465 family protein [Marinicaulis sp.]|nr:DUF1465 family protein [Marinicaulis sp.]NNL89170.1 DUF1465 family protein [Marinicaulis sp.]
MALFSSDEIHSGAASFVNSELFARTFREGMKLVEESANYLDGQGRDASQNLGRESALAYAGSSMRLTTELMQIASWLLVLRAVREGEMELTEAADKKYRIQSNSDEKRPPYDEGLPTDLIGLIENAHQLFERIARLDRDLFTENGTVRESDAMGQQRALRNAFAASR